MMGDRGQAYTLEGVIAAIIVASSVLYGLQAVSVTPWATSADERTLDTMRSQASDLLAAAADNGTLQRVVTCIDATTGEPHPRIGLPPGNTSFFPTGRNATEFGHMLNDTLGANGYRYAVYFDHWNESAGEVESTLVFPDSEPTPSRATVSASYPVTVFDGTPVRYDDQCQDDATTLRDQADQGELYLTEAGPGGADDPHTFTVVEVRLVVW